MGGKGKGKNKGKTGNGSVGEKEGDQRGSQRGKAGLKMLSESGTCYRPSVFLCESDS